MLFQLCCESCFLTLEVLDSEDATCREIAAAYGWEVQCEEEYGDLHFCPDCVEKGKAEIEAMARKEGW